MTLGKGNTALESRFERGAPFPSPPAPSWDLGMTCCLKPQQFEGYQWFPLWWFLREVTISGFGEVESETQQVFSG